MNQDSSSSSTDPLQAAWNFGKLMPGFGFIEQWTKGASAAMPTMGQWVAPTLDPEELDKRIQDLRTVQFWLEQNSRMIAMTIQALEVQRMTLSTLKSMNVSADALRDSLQARTDESTAGSDDAAAAPEAGAAASTEAIDPMRWWGALTQQFTELATHTMQDALKPEAAAAASPQPSARAASARAAKAAPAGKAAATKAAAKGAAAPRRAKSTPKAPPTRAPR